MPTSQAQARLEDEYDYEMESGVAESEGVVDAERFADDQAVDYADEPVAEAYMASDIESDSKSTPSPEATGGAAGRKALKARCVSHLVIYDTYG